MRRFGQILSLFMVAVLSAHAVPAVLNYAGQVAVNGQPFDGQGLFKFALVNADGNATYWSNDGTNLRRRKHCKSGWASCCYRALRWDS